MARKTHRPDDILWAVSTADIQASSYGDRDNLHHAVNDDGIVGNHKTDVIDTVTLGRLLDTKYPRKSIVKLFEEKLIHINGHKATPRDEVAADDEIRIAMAKEKIDYEPVSMDLVILYEDDDLLVVDKPAGMTVNSKGQVSLANGVAHYFKEHGIKRKVRFLNRLDRDTTGCIVIAKSGLAQSLYQQQMDSDVFEKWYVATVEGIITDDSGSLEFPMDKSSDGIHYEVSPNGKNTRTDFIVLHRCASRSVDNSVNNRQEPVDRVNENVDIAHRNVDKTGSIVDNVVDNCLPDAYTEVSVRLYTGKTHQIRVAFSHIGHPLVGDTLYGATSTGTAFKLRAEKIVFTHMRTGERITVTA